MAPFMYFAYSEQRKRTKLAISPGLHGRPVGIKSCLGWPSKTPAWTRLIVVPFLQATLVRLFDQAANAPQAANSGLKIFGS